MKKVLFICIHNSARSQMAEAYVNHLSQGKASAESAGLKPGVLNPHAVAAMNEEGIDISAEVPKVLTTEAVKESDVVITMGCARL